MTYANEEIITALKKARDAKGLSQRDLSARTGVPQSHISKIESGSADIRLSSLIELARALDLEVRLVPRKALPAVESLVRSTAPAATIKELQRALGTVDRLRLAYPELSALNRLQENLRTISSFRAIDKYLDTIKTATQPLAALQKQADTLQQLDKAAHLPSKTLKQLEHAANRLQEIRNRLVHAVPSAQPRPAYRLDDDDDDNHHQHKELGDG